MKNFKQKFGDWAIVTGATSKVGKAFARQLADQGVNLILFGRRAFLLKEVASNLKATSNIKVKFAVIDLSKDNFLRKIEDTIRNIDVRLLVSNAEAKSIGSESIDKPASNSIVHFNAAAQAKIGEWFANHLIAKGQRGGIALLSADSAYEDTSASTNQASTGYLLNLGKSLNYDLQDQGIHVTVALQDPNDVPCLTKMVSGNSNANRPLKRRPAEALAKESLKALYQNRPFHIGGMMNKMTLTSMSVMNSMGKAVWGLGARMRRRVFQRNVKDTVS